MLISPHLHLINSSFLYCTSPSLRCCGGHSPMHSTCTAMKTTSITSTTQHTAHSICRLIAQEAQKQLYGFYLLFIPISCHGTISSIHFYRCVTLCVSISTPPLPCPDLTCPVLTCVKNYEPWETIDEKAEGAAREQETDVRADTERPRSLHRNTLRSVLCVCVCVCVCVCMCVCVKERECEGVGL
jgi:hypothetical protein